MSDPNTVKETLDAVIDAFNEQGHGIPTRELFYNRLTAL